MNLNPQRCLLNLQTPKQLLCVCVCVCAHVLSFCPPANTIHAPYPLFAVMLGKGQNRLWMGLTMDQEHGWQWVDGKPFRYLRWDSGRYASPSHHVA